MVLLQLHVYLQHGSDKPHTGLTPSKLTALSLEQLCLSPMVNLLCLSPVVNLLCLSPVVDLLVKSCTRHAMRHPHSVWVSRSRLSGTHLYSSMLETDFFFIWILRDPKQSRNKLKGSEESWNARLIPSAVFSSRWGSFPQCLICAKGDWKVARQLSKFSHTRENNKNPVCFKTRAIEKLLSVCPMQRAAEVFLMNWKSSKGLSFPYCSHPMRVRVRVRVRGGVVMGLCLPSKKEAKTRKEKEKEKNNKKTTSVFWKFGAIFRRALEGGSA